jgi:ribosomal-protein-alanine N-acetyltransferase
VKKNDAKSDTFGLMSNGAPIETPRLQLMLFSPEALNALREENYDDAARIQGFEFSDEFLSSVNDIFLARQIEGMRRWPFAPGWYARAILRKEDEVVIGHCGFHGNPEDYGRAEVGYTILAPYRRRGYAVEAVRGLVDWAKVQGTRVVFAAVSSDNISSLGVVAKLGFRQTGVQGLDDGHEEFVFEFKL